MKKIYLIAIVSLVASAGFAQKRASNIKQHQKKDSQETRTQKPTSVNLLESKAAGDTIWQNDFSVTADWSTGTELGHTLGEWNIVTALTPTLVAQAANRGYPSNLNSTSGGNFALIDSDGASDGELQNAWIETTNNIDLSALGMAPAGIQWTEAYRHFQEFNFIAVSTDGGSTWTEFAVNEVAEVPVNTNSSDPEYDEINITPAMPVTGWNNQVKIRFRYQGAWDWFWAIDDIAVVELPLAVNLKAQTAIWSFNNDGTVLIPYTQVPQAQLATMYSYLITKNAGTVTATNTLADIIVGGAGSFASQTDPITLAGGLTDTLIDVTGFTPSALGNYSIVMASSSTETDFDLSDNNATLFVDVTPGIYARDNGTLEGWYGSRDDDGDLLVDPVAFQQDFEINAKDTVYALQAVFPANQDWEEMEIYYNIYDGAGTPIYDGATVAVPVKTIFPTDLSPTDGSNNIWVSFPLEMNGMPGVELDPINGDVFTVEISHDIDSLFLASSGIGYANAGSWTTAGLTYNGLTGSTSYYITDNYMLRMDMNKPAPVSVDELVTVSKMQNVPNPFNINSRIQYTMDQSGDVVFMITDMSGKIVTQRNLGLLNAGEHGINVNASEMASGLYYYSIIVNGNATTKKMSIVK